MKNVLFLFCLLGIVDSSTSKEIYIWLDDKGIQHFSDTPAPNATTLSIESFDGSKNSKSSTDVKQPKPQSIAKALTPKVNILSPSDGETIRSNEGNINIQIGLNRELSESEQLQLLMNGQLFGEPSTKTVWQLKNIERGTHRFSIQIVGSGKVIASSSIVTVYLHRASVN
ncbi:MULTISPECIES: DUF4124 domain-containing protein [Vibrio]|uniref:DUF4124 domain-containing protein n=1 Tax=Vibrio TaxID=662 RepID=UPI00158A5A61|nr:MULTISPECIES: DUF4124 domain-containing protein [Vibrio]